LLSEQIDQSGNGNHVYNIRQFPETFYQISLFSDNDFHLMAKIELTDDLARALSDALNEFL
jgi:hypothetical protein